MSGDVMNAFSFFRLLLVLPACLLIGSCARGEGLSTSSRDAQAAPAVSPSSAVPPRIHEPLPEVAEIWRPLVDRLHKDGVSGREVAELFARLGELSQDPMGRKVKELYTGKFMRQPRPADKKESPTASGIPRPWYEGVVTDANARRCRSFINTHYQVFQNAEERYGVPAEVAAALLFVETRLGDYLGGQNAFITLASMSASRDPKIIPDWIEKLPGVEKRFDWVSERMRDKADWAYGELRALVMYSLENGLDPFEIPGSVYGAIGLCQFMPSNISRFAVDGNGDGLVDLFDPADAVFSLCHYLVKHGWKKDLDIKSQVKVLKRYNNLNIYANTILALAEKIGEMPGRPTVRRSQHPSLAAPAAAEGQG